MSLQNRNYIDCICDTQEGLENYPPGYIDVSLQFHDRKHICAYNVSQLVLSIFVAYNSAYLIFRAINI